jgi:hypothetical protein
MVKKDRGVLTHEENMLTAFRAVALGTVLGAGILILGCRDNAFAPTNAPTNRQSRVSSLQNSSAHESFSRGIEHEILRLEPAIPGIGGMYVSGNEIVVFTPPGANPGRTISALKREAHNMFVSAGVKAQLMAGERIRIREGKYALSQLVAWQEELTLPLSRIEGFSGIDADESTNRVRVNLTDGAQTVAVQRAAAAAGVPVDAVTVQIVPTAIALSGLRGTWRPTGGGIQIVTSSNEKCAMGFNVTTSTGLNGLLTAGHCARGNLGPGGGGVNERVYQPLYSSTTDLGVATVNINPAWTLQDPACGSYSRCTLADVLFAKYDLASTLSKRVAFTASLGQHYQGGSITLTGWWDNVVAPAASYFVGEAVDKMGGETGWTRGTISQTCINVPVQSDAGFVYMAVCSDAVTGSRVGSGESGAPVFIPPAPGQIHNPLTPIGILFAGVPMNVYDADAADPWAPYYCSTGCTYYYTKWSNIQTAFGVSVFPN